ncbi:MAG: hypothetical protein VB095_14295 [Anaerovorax sp.]|nr:hypothetical protein [Anaerovorax sp.]
MNIQSINNYNVFISRFQMQNPKFKNIVNKINEDVGEKQNFDTVSFSLKAQELLKTTKEKTPTNNLIDYENSPQNGTYTEAEWAEISLHHQRNGLETVYKLVDYFKEKLNYTTSRINELQGIVDGTYGDSFISPDIAKEWIDSYKKSISTDYSKVVEDYVEIYRGFVNEYDASSNGLASKVSENYLNTLSAESLGLIDLSNDPKEIMTALENASKKLGEMIKAVEANFYEATSGNKWEAISDIPNDAWSKRLEHFRAMTECGNIDENTKIVGEALNIDKSLLEKLENLSF